MMDDTNDIAAPTKGEGEDLARHAAKMAKKKAARDKIMAGKAGEKGQKAKGEEARDHARKLAR